VRQGRRMRRRPDLVLQARERGAFLPKGLHNVHRVTLRHHLVKLQRLQEAAAYPPLRPVHRGLVRHTGAYTASSMLSHSALVYPFTLAASSSLAWPSSLARPGAPSPAQATPSQLYFRPCVHWRPSQLKTSMNWKENSMV